MNGFLISTSMNKELKGYKEFSNAANSTVSALSAPEKPSLTNCSDFTQSLLEELRNLKIKENFSQLEKYKSIVIVRNRTPVLPSEIFLGLRKEDCSFYAIKRIVPLDFITKFDEVQIANFIQKNKFEGTFKIQFEGRLCPDNLRTDLFKIIIPLIDCKVNLSSPDYVIVIQAFKSMIGMTIMKNDPNNFNFSVYAKEEAESKDESTEECEKE